MALQVGIPYVIIGPDGTRAVFNDSADPDFIGYLDPESGVTGLDSPEVRESSDVLVEEDGGVHGDFYYGRRPFTFQGIVWPDPIIEANRRMDKLAAATNAMRADGTVTWTEEGTVEKMLSFRRQQPLRFAGRRPKTFMVALVSASSRIVSAAEQNLAIPALGTVSLAGRTYPRTYPVAYGGGGGIGGDSVVNSGNETSQPRFRVDGPITNPIIANDTTGEELRLIYTLAAGEYLIVDNVSRTIKLGGTVDRYSALDFEHSTWWNLDPGLNRVRLRATAYSAPAALTVYWRHAWIS